MYKILIGVVILIVVALVILYTVVNNDKIIDEKKISCGAHTVNMIHHKWIKFGIDGEYISLQIDDMPEFSLRYTWDMPYSDEVYADAPRYYYKDLDMTRNADGRLLYPIYMLYVDPAVYTKSDFETIHEVISSCSQEILNWEKAKDFYAITQYGGIVYGTKEDFTKKYQKSNKEWYVIYPNGKVWKVDDRTSYSQGGLTSVIMPGKEIILDPSQEIRVMHKPMEKMTLEKLRTFKNTKTGKSIDEEFTLVIKSK